MKINRTEADDILEALQLQSEETAKYIEVLESSAPAAIAEAKLKRLRDLHTRVRAFIATGCTQCGGTGDHGNGGNCNRCGGSGRAIDCP